MGWPCRLTCDMPPWRIWKTCFGGGTILSSGPRRRADRNSRWCSPLLEGAGRKHRSRRVAAGTRTGRSWCSHRRPEPGTCPYYTSVLGYHALSHSNDCPVLFERNLVHERSYKVKSATVSEKQPLVFGWIGDCSAIKAFSFVPHANQYLPIQAAAAGDVNLFLLILVIAV